MIKILLMSTITMSVYSSIALCVTGEYQMAANDTSDVRQTKDVQLCRLICAGARPFKVDGECLCRAPDFSKGEKYPKYYRLNEEKFIGFDSLYNRIYAPSVGTSVTTNRKSAESRLQYNNLENERRVSELLVKNCVNGCDGGYVNMSCECIPFDVMYDPIMPESDKHKRQIDLLYRTKKSHKEQVLDAEEKLYNHGIVLEYVDAYDNVRSYCGDALSKENKIDIDCSEIFGLIGYYRNNKIRFNTDGRARKNLTKRAIPIPSKKISYLTFYDRNTGELVYQTDYSDFINRKIRDILTEKGLSDGARAEIEELLIDHRDYKYLTEKYDYKYLLD